MDAYTNPTGRRAIRSEIERYVVEQTGVRPVMGLGDIIETGDARSNTERVAGFMEVHDLREWVLRLDAQRPLVWRTAPVPERLSCAEVGFLLSLGFGNGSPLPQPSGRWDIMVNGHFALSVRVVKHSQLWRARHARLAFAANRIEAAEPFGSITLSSVIDNESFAAFGPAILCVPAEWLTPGEPATIRVHAHGPVASTRWLQLAAAPSLTNQTDIYRAVDLLTDRRVPTVDGKRVFFGDIHTHSGDVHRPEHTQGCGLGTREENYAYAHGPGGLDFYALTDHEWQIDPDRTDAYLGLADRYEEPGRFVCLPGYEFTSLLYGHRNVYFRSAGGTVANATRPWDRPTMDPEHAVTPEQLWAELEKCGVPFLTIPHHPSAASHPCSWDHYNPAYDRLVEIYSCWGSSEYYGDFPRGVSDRYRTLDVRDAVRRGLRMGFVAGADGHDGHPGNAQSPLVKHHHQFHHLGSGLTGVLADELTRDQVFDSLRARRCFATTGTPIVLSVKVDGAVMGSESAAPGPGARPRVDVACRGTNGIDHVRIVKNGDVVATVPMHGRFECEIQWEDPAYQPGQAASYYARAVQIDRESAWSSPVWIG